MLNIYNNKLKLNFLYKFKYLNNIIYLKSNLNS